MVWPIVVAWIHYVAVMLLIASLLGEHLQLTQALTAAEARTLQRLDIIYGGSATLVLVTEIMRMYLEKGTAYYLQNGPFHAPLFLVSKQLDYSSFLPNVVQMCRYLLHSCAFSSLGVSSIIA